MCRGRSSSSRTWRLRCGCPSTSGATITCASSHTSRGTRPGACTSCSSTSNRYASMAADALAALRSWAIDVDLGGDTFTVPPRPATDWFLAILDEDTPLPLIPGLMDGSAEERITDLILDGLTTTDEIVTRSREL